MEDLQLVFLILGGLAILAVLIHGVWSIRRHQSNTIKDNKRPDIRRAEVKVRDSEGFDADGIGEVRVRQAGEVKKAVVEPKISQPKPTVEDVKTERVEPVLDAPHVEIEPVEQKAEQPTQASLFDDAEDEASNAKTEEQLQKESIADPVVEAAPEPEVEEELPDPYDVLVLHVMAKEGETIKGAELLPCMLSMNFKFGDMNIFHRHEDNAGTGKVIFSIADMVNPGTFDPDNMEQFTSHGIVMFMRLPCHGDPVRNFSIMLNSACQLADDLGAVVCDGQREPWDDEKKQDYIRRIRA